MIYQTELNESRTFRFIHESDSIALQFLEGQEIIRSLALNHEVTNTGFAYFRDAVLAAEHLTAFLKNGESLGFYIDNLDPYFLFKLETNYKGLLRTLLLPADFNQFPEKLNGQARLTKMASGSPAPYTSILEIKDQGLLFTVNEFLRQSYQTEAKVIISPDSDQSMMARKLPPSRLDKTKDPGRPLSQFLSDYETQFEKIYKMGLNDQQAIIKEFESIGFTYLASFENKFTCSCSREQTISSLMTLGKIQIEEAFKNDKTIEVKCDYCHTYYLIKKSEMQKVLN